MLVDSFTLNRTPKTTFHVALYQLQKRSAAPWLELLRSHTWPLGRLKSHPWACSWSHPESCRQSCASCHSMKHHDRHLWGHHHCIPPSYAPLHQYSHQKLPVDSSSKIRNENILSESNQEFQNMVKFCTSWMTTSQSNCWSISDEKSRIVKRRHVEEFLCSSSEHMPLWHTCNIQVFFKGETHCKHARGWKISPVHNSAEPLMFMENELLEKIK